MIALWSNYAKESGGAEKVERDLRACAADLLLPAAVTGPNGLANALVALRGCALNLLLPTELTDLRALAHALIALRACALDLLLPAAALAGLRGLAHALAAQLGGGMVYDAELRREGNGRGAGDGVVTSPR